MNYAVSVGVHGPMNFRESIPFLVSIHIAAGTSDNAIPLAHSHHELIAVLVVFGMTYGFSNIDARTSPASQSGFIRKGLVSLFHFPMFGCNKYYITPGNFLV
jgi:hypothetical protein